MSDQKAQKTVVIFDGQSHEFGEAKIGDLVAFERYFEVKATVLQPTPKFDDDGLAVYDDEGEQVLEPAEVSLEWMAFLLWRSLRRQGVIDKNTAFDDDFLDRIDSFEQVDAEEADDADPSVPDQRHG